MIGFFKLCASSFALLTIVSFCGAVLFNFLSLSPKASPSYREKCEDNVWRCVRVCQYTLVFATISAFCWLCADLLSYCAFCL